MDPEELDQMSPVEAPLVMRMMEHIPGISASLGFAAFRGSNTLMRGGFMDDSIRAGRTAKYSAFAKNSMTPVAPGASSYYGTAARKTRLASAVGTDRAKMAFAKPARVNHITGRPRALSRYHSLSIFNASQTSGMYSPFQIAYKGAGRAALRSSGFTSALGMSDDAVKAAKGGDIFQRGMVSMITAGRRIDLLESKALGGGLGSRRAATKLGTAQIQAARLAGMNNTALGAAGVTSAVSGAGKVGLTGNLMASAGSTAGSRYVQGYFRGALGHLGAGGLTQEAAKGARMAQKHLVSGFMQAGLVDDAKAGFRLAGEVFDKGAFKTLGTSGVFKTMGTKSGAAALTARGAAMAIPGLNLVATAALVYDLAKMGGELIKSGVNLAKDGVKSLKGSIDKPMFGMGYKDNEIAATSRARGVMAIQNSRLNARSLLGSEGSMMAAHFG